MAIKLKADTTKPEGRAAWSTRVSGGNVCPSCAEWNRVAPVRIHVVLLAIKTSCGS
jgi:hypothetical protein